MTGKDTTSRVNRRLIVLPRQIVWAFPRVYRGACIKGTIKLSKYIRSGTMILAKIKNKQLTTRIIPIVLFLKIYRSDLHLRSLNWANRIP